MVAEWIYSFPVTAYLSDTMARIYHIYLTMMSYLLKAAESDTRMIRVLSDDTNVFVMLVYWVYRNKIRAPV